MTDRLPALPITLLGDDRATLDLGACFAVAYDRIAADDEVDYGALPPPPAFNKRETSWMKQLLDERGLRGKKRRGGKMN